MLAGSSSAESHGHDFGRLAVGMIILSGMLGYGRSVGVVVREM
jgi:hypothetical protein